MPIKKDKDSLDFETGPPRSLSNPLLHCIFSMLAKLFTQPYLHVVPATGV